MFWSKKNLPKYIFDKEKLVGVQTSKGNFKIRNYPGLMMGSPTANNYYVFNQHNEKIAWDIHSISELEEFIKEM